MKRAISMTLAVVMLLVMCVGTGFTFRSSSDGSGEDDLFDGIWGVLYPTDEFGDRDYTERASLVNTYIGTYNNEYSQSGDLLVAVYYTEVYEPHCDTLLVFRLFEDLKTTRLDTSDDVKISVKIGEKKYTDEETLKPYEDGSVVAPLYGYGKDAWHDDENTECMDAIIEALNEDEEVHCIIYVGEAKYDFIIDGNGFSEAKAEAYGETEDAENKDAKESADNKKG